MSINSIIMDVQNIAEAISSVLNIDVTVVDENYIRIAGTGRYTECIGDKVGKDSAFSYAMEKGENLIILDPGKHPVCIKCTSKEECKEYGEVCCPIMVNGRAIAVIGLIAFTWEQRRKIIESKDDYLKYVEIMSQLLSSKILEKKRHDDVRLLAKELKIVVESVNRGILALDINGRAVNYNGVALNCLGINEEELDNIDFSLVFGVDMKKNNDIKNREFYYDSSKFRGIFDINSIEIDKDVFRHIVVFNDIRDVLDTVNSIYGSTGVISFEDIIGSSVQLNRVIEKSKLAAKSNSTILITGESGTGKELIARSIHHFGKRKNKIFLPINCGAIPDNLLESELFGYEDGAFTGARKGGRTGKFELAHKGTVFLDEIGDMPLHLQTKLLRVLQEGVVEKIGSNSFISVDVRIIAATNKNLSKMVANGEFREDLYYRLNVIPIEIPPLRDRREDIIELGEYFIKTYNKLLGKNVTDIQGEAIDLIKAYRWPGNVRELQNSIEYAMNMCDGKRIHISDLPERVKRDIKNDESPDNNYGLMTIKEIEKLELIRRIKKYKNSENCMEDVARSLGISRATLYRKLKEYSLRIKHESINYI